MNDSGEFQEVESNFCEKPAVMPSPPSLLSRDKRLPLDTWNLTGPQEIVFGNPRSMFESSQTPYQGILHSTTPSVTGAVPVHGSTGTPVASSEERIGSTTTMPMFAERPSTMNSYSPADIPLNSMVGQQRQQISELQLDKFSFPSTFSCWKTRVKNKVTTCSDFPWEAMLWIKEVEVVDSVGGLKSSR